MERERVEREERLRRVETRKLAWDTSKARKNILEEVLEEVTIHRKKEGSRRWYWTWWRSLWPEERSTS